MARWTASAKWAAGPALDGQCDTPLALSLSEWLGGTCDAVIRLKSYCLFRTAGRPSANAPVRVCSSARSSVKAKDGQPVITLGPSTLNIIFAFGSVLIDRGNSRPRHGPALLAAAGAMYLHVPINSDIFTWIWSSFPVRGDFVAPVHWPDSVLAV